MDGEDNENRKIPLLFSMEFRHLDTAENDEREYICKDVSCKLHALATVAKATESDGLGLSRILANVLFTGMAMKIGLLVQFKDEVFGDHLISQALKRIKPSEVEGVMVELYKVCALSDERQNGAPFVEQLRREQAIAELYRNNVSE